MPHQFMLVQDSLQMKIICRPLLVGYEVPLFGRSSLHFQTGIAASIISAHSGKIMQDGSISSFEDLSTFETRKIGTLQSLPSFHYQVKVRNKLSLFLGGQANFHLTESVNLKENNGQQFRFFGLTFGGKLSL